MSGDAIRGFLVTVGGDLCAASSAGLAVLQYLEYRALPRNDPNRHRRLFGTGAYLLMFLGFLSLGVATVFR